MSKKKNWKESKLTLPKSLRILRNKPMPSLDIDELEQGEELPDDGYHLVGDILAQRAADEEGRFAEAFLRWVLEGEVAHVVQRLGQDGQRHAELLRLAVAVGWPVQVAEEEVPDREGLLFSAVS